MYSCEIQFESIELNNIEQIQIYQSSDCIRLVHSYGLLLCIYACMYANEVHFAKIE